MDIKLKTQKRQTKQPVILTIKKYLEDCGINCVYEEEIKMLKASRFSTIKKSADIIVYDNAVVDCATSPRHEITELTDPDHLDQIREYVIENT